MGNFTTKMHPPNLVDRPISAQPHLARQAPVKCHLSYKWTAAKALNTLIVLPRWLNCCYLGQLACPFKPSNQKAARMLKTIFLVSVLATALNPSFVQAQSAAPQPASSVVISALEKSEYFRNKDIISEKTERCLSDTWQTHLDFYHKYGISKYL